MEEMTELEIEEDELKLKLILEDMGIEEDDC